jgi:beta-glucosidase-like glycosyl hydrolase
VCKQPRQRSVRAGALDTVEPRKLAINHRPVYGRRYVCENNHTENTILKSWGGFKGWVCSDYDGTRSTVDAALGGLDIAMPGP